MIPYIAFIENVKCYKLYLEAGAAHVDVGHYEVPLAGEVSVPAHGPLAAHRLGAGAAVTVGKYTKLITLFLKTHAHGIFLV